MKMKELLLWLSVIAVVQVVLIAFGGSFFGELMAIKANKVSLYGAAFMTGVSTIVTVALYRRTFKKINRKQKK